MDVQLLQTLIATFAAERDGEQFHNPKNLAIALSVEASELLEEFQWLTPEQAADLSSERHERVEMEIGDVVIYLLRLCDVLNLRGHLAPDRVTILA